MECHKVGPVQIADCGSDSGIKAMQGSARQVQVIGRTERQKDCVPVRVCIFGGARKLQCRNDWPFRMGRVNV